MSLLGKVAKIAAGYAAIKYGSKLVKENNGSKVKEGAYAECSIEMIGEQAGIVVEHGYTVLLTSENVQTCRFVKEKKRHGQTYYYYEILFHDGKTSYARMRKKYRDAMLRDTEPKTPKEALDKLKKSLKDLQKTSEKVTNQFQEMAQVAEANSGKLQDINEIARKALAGKENKCDDDWLNTIRKYWCSSAIMTDDYTSETREEKVSEEDLLPGELSAVTFQIGDYMIRAQRIYKSYASAQYSELPATEEDLKYYVRKYVNPNDGYFPDDAPGNDGFRISHEISARRIGDFLEKFTVVCCASQRLFLSWCQYESIEAICTVKENANVADESASLLVLRICRGDQDYVDCWHKLDPNGKISKLSLHPYNSDIDNERFRDVEAEENAE